MESIGRTTWVIPGSRIPLASTGREPDFTSRDELFLFNTGPAEAQVTLTIYHTDRDPVGPYVISVPARRVRCVRINDLIDPEAVPLESAYGIVARSTVPVVLQYTHHDTGQAEHAVASTIPFSGP
jgi:hypothetical protein